MGVIGFPREITTAILSRLPVKAIFKCRSVCKTWRSLIDNPYFVETHLHISSSSSFAFILNDANDHMYIPETDDHEVDGDEESQIIVIRKINLLFRKYSLHSIHSCNGLVYLSKSFISAYKAFNFFGYICNPCTRQFLILPIFICPDLKPEYKYTNLQSGFGLDPLSKEYKVVLVFEPRRRRSSSSRQLRLEVQVYTLGSNSWRKIGYAPNVNFLSSSSSVFLNGSCHWLAEGCDVGLPVIWSFNFGCEEFGVIQSPEFSTPRYYPYDRFQILVLGGCLSVVDSCFNDHIEIWIMKDYNLKGSWTKHIVMNEGAKHWKQTCQPVSIWKNGEILLLCDHLNVVSFNMETGECDPLEVNGLPGDKRWPERIRAFPFVESLVPLQSAWRAISFNQVKTSQTGMMIPKLERGDEAHGKKKQRTK